MGLGIVWGMASVMMLLGVASGFEESQRRTLAAYGEKFILLRLNRAELDRSAAGKERRLQMETPDLERLRVGAPAIRRFTPMNMAYSARIMGPNGPARNVYMSGALPEIAKIRHVPLAEGRFYDEFDEENCRRVIVLGPMARQQLFGDRPAIGRKLRVTGFSFSSIMGRDQARPVQEASRRGGKAANRSQVVSSPTTSSATVGSSASSGGSSGSALSSGRPPVSAWWRTGNTPGVPRAESLSTAPKRDPLDMPSESFEVIGVIKDVEVQKESYASLARVALIPFSTSTSVFDRDFGTMLIEPETVEDHDLALHQFREVMGARYGFTADDRNSVVIYFDAIERARSINAVFGGVRIFLAAVGVLILAIGAIGVMNVVLVSVAARTFEIGLRKALGATPLVIYMQFFAETVLVCLASGGLGFLLGTGGIALLSWVPLPEGFSKPSLEARSVAIAFGLLSVVAVLAGLYPARRAARMTPIDALRARG